jgi:hypothetical protein
MSKVIIGDVRGSDASGDGYGADPFGDGFGPGWIIRNGWGCGCTQDASGNSHGSDYAYMSCDGEEPKNGDGYGLGTGDGLG